MRQTEVVYIAFNDRIPSCIKIGKTEDERTLDERMKALGYASGVPGEYKCLGAWETPKSKSVEAKIHSILKKLGKHESKEFFTKDCLDVVKDMLELVKIRDINLTPKEISKPQLTVKIEDTRQKEATHNISTINSWKTSLKAYIANLPVGSFLTLNRDPNVKIELLEDKKSFLYNGEVSTLSSLTVKLHNNRHLSPRSYWSYNGTRLDKLIMNEQYGKL
jgi:hypothetical protein